ncbi:ankyrin repeat containing protein [Metarhizium brunneum]
MSEDLLRIWVDIQTTSATTTQASRMQIVTNEKFVATLTGVEDRIARVEEMLQKQSRRLQMNQYTQVKSAYGTERQTKRRSAYETCKFLIQAGADVDYKPLGAFDNSPRIKACHFLLEGNLSESAAGALRAITNGSEYLDDFIEQSSFTRTHRIILGLSIGDLERGLISHPGEINAQDSMGRTALAWAAARGDSHSILTLLRYGADSNIMDSQISGPRSNASAQGHTACVKLLLDAGTNPDPPRPGGINEGGPLNAAARRSDDPILVKLLLDFGAEVDQFGVDGKTALCHAAQNNDVL